MTRGRALGAVLVGTFSTLSVAQPAVAGTVTVSVGAAEATVRYDAAAGERNSVNVSDWPTGSGTVTISDNAGVSAGPGCHPAPAPRREHLCVFPAGLAVQLHVRLGDRNDSIGMPEARRMTVTVEGGPGNDSILGPRNTAGAGSPFWMPEVFFTVGRRHSDSLRSTATVPGASLSGGPGVDKVHGGAGPDRLDAGPGNDQVDGWRGDDRIAARDRAIDYIECSRGRDRLMLDRFDFPYRRCGPVDRRGRPPLALPLLVYADEDAERILLGCPADKPTACKGRVTVAPRGGRQVFRGRYRVKPGRVFGPWPGFSRRAWSALERRGARVTVRERDRSGSVRTASRVVDAWNDPYTGEGADSPSPLQS